MKISDEANKKLQKENDEIKLMIDSIQKIITNKF
jgi:hypothetical protein